MTSPPQNIIVKCPDCGHEFLDFIRPSINLTLDDFDDEYLDRCQFATCPACGTRIQKSLLIVDKDGVFSSK